MSSRNRAILFVIVAALALFGGWRVREAYLKKASQTNPGGRPGGAGGTRVVSVSVGEAKTGAVRQEILLTGALKPKEQVDVTAKATGRLERLNVQVGDFVRKGRLIAVLEDDELQQQVRRAAAQQNVAKASLAQRRAELANARAEMERARTLASEQLVPQKEFEARETAYQVVEAQVKLAQAQEEQAQAELNELKIRLEQAQIFAPMDGHVGKRYVDVGALVNPNTPIVNLVNIAIMVTAANVPEREIAKLRVGTQATVSVDAYADHKFVGRVARISPVLDAATRSATVEVEIPNTDGGLKAEMFARVTLDLQSTRQAVLIPREALVYRGQQAGVYVLEQKRPIFRSIETGITHGEDVEVVSQLEPGTRIVTRGATMLTDGSQIEIAGERGRPNRGQQSNHNGDTR